MHLKNWTFVAVDTICSKIASILPNIAYVAAASKPGVTVKACQRGLLNYFGQGFGGTPLISDGGHSWLTIGEYRSKALSVVKPHEELEPVEDDHRLYQLFMNPNPVDTPFDIAYELQMFEELCGVSYEWLVPNNWGMPCERWVIPSHWVWPRTGGGRYVNPEHQHADELIQYYEIRPWGGMGSAGMLRIPPNEIIMTRWKSPINKIDGYSKLAAIAQWIDSEESISASRWSQFQNQARPEFWVELGPGYEDPNDDRIARIEAKFAAKIQGEYNYGKPVITPPGAKITPLSFSPTEMAYFDSENQVRDMILSTFRVPPAAVGIVKEMTYGSILATLASLCTYCLNPRLALRGQMYTKHLAKRFAEKGRPIKIWFDDCVPADPSQINSDIETDLHAYAISPNEVRALRGRKPWKHGGEDPMAQGPAGIMPLPLNTGEDLAAFAELIQPLEDNQQPEALPGMPGSAGLPLDDDASSADQDQRLQQDFLEQAEQSGIENPNGPPHKDDDLVIEKALDAQGGELPVIDETALEQADFITLPEEVAGTNCGNCHYQKDQVCQHPDLNGQPVTERNCCAYWSAPGILREWREGVEESGIRFKRLGLPCYVVKTAGPHKYSTTQFNLPPELAERILDLIDLIDDDDLAEDGKEDTPHITVKYGLHTDDAEEVRQVIGSVPVPVLVTLGRLSIFDTEQTGKDYEVLKIDVESKPLRDLNHRLASQLANSDRHPTYRPHITLAYLKPGVSAKYLDINNLEGEEVTLDTLIFSTKDGQTTALPLGVAGDGTERGVSSTLQDPTPRDPDRLLEVPDIRQPDDYSCGACCAMAVGRYFGVGPADLDAWKRELGTSEKKSTSPLEIVRYLSELGLDVQIQQRLTLDDLRAAWRAGQPVICPIQEYGVPGKEASFKYGHYVVVVGVSLGQVFVFDPSIDNVLGIPGGTVANQEDPDVLQTFGRSLIPEELWQRVWHDEDAGGNTYDRCGIVVGPPRTEEISKGFPSVQEAGRWLASKWAALEARYGRKAALAMAVAMLATAPLPGNIAAVVAAAEAIRGVRGYFAGSLGEGSEPWSQPETLANGSSVSRDVTFVGATAPTEADSPSPRRPLNYLKAYLGKPPLSFQEMAANVASQLGESLTPAELEAVFADVAAQ